MGGGEAGPGRLLGRLPATQKRTCVVCQLGGISEMSISQSGTQVVTVTLVFLPQMICCAFRLGSEDIISPRLGLGDRRSLEKLF